MAAEPLFKKHRETLVTAGIAVLGLLLARAAYDVQMGKVTALKGEIAVEEKKSAAMDRILVLNNTLQKLGQEGWPSTDFASAVDTLSAIAEATDLRIEGITPLDKKDESTFVSIPFLLSGEATYRNIIRFLATLVASPHLLLVREVTLTPGDMQASPALGMLLKVNLRGEAVFFKK
ncbi:MAG: hypothetical protein ACM3L6_02725 [Deltaproteobacteria bacterium]